MSENESSANSYWKSSIKIALAILSIWFTVSYLCGIVFREWLDLNFPRVGHAPFGFWMAQQGSIICFVILLVTYTLLMNRLDKKCGLEEDSV